MGAGEMSQQLKELVAFVGDQILIPGTHIVAHNCL